MAKEAIKTRQSLIVVENEDDDERLTPSLATKSTQGVEILQSNNSSTTEEQNTDSVSTKASDRGKEVKSSGASISLSANSAHANIDILCEILFDGGSRGNPGVGGAGAQVQCVWMLAEGENEVSSQERKVQIRTYLEKGITNNQAEYWGVISGLQEALNIVKECKHRYQIENPNDCHVTLLVQGDSKLVINQLCGLYRCKSENLKALFAEAKKLVLDLDQLSTLDASFEHILRSYNYVADGEYQVSEQSIDGYSNNSHAFSLIIEGLANEAMDSRRSWSKTVDHCRLCPENRKRKV